MCALTLCKGHYQKKRRHGDPLYGAPLFSRGDFPREHSLIAQDLYWAAGLIEAEGCFKKTAGRALAVGMTDFEPLDKLQALFGGWINGPYRRGMVHYKPIKVWHVGVNNALHNLLLPLMSPRRARALQKLHLPTERIHHRYTLDSDNPHWLAWAVGFLEGDGYFGLPGEARVGANSIDLPTLERLQTILGGTITGPRTTTHQPFWEWNLQQHQSLGCMALLYGSMSPRRQRQIAAILGAENDKNYTAREKFNHLATVADALTLEYNPSWGDVTQTIQRLAVKYGVTETFVRSHSKRCTRGAFTYSDLPELKRLWATGNYTLNQLGALYGIHGTTVHYHVEPRIKDRKLKRQARVREGIQIGSIQFPA